MLADIQVILYTNTLPQPLLIQTVYLGTAGGNWKKWYYDHKISLNNRKNVNDTRLLKYVLDVKEKYKEEQSLKW